MAKRGGLLRLFRRLWWDLRDPKERVYYGYWLVWQVPGIFGNLLRAGYLGPRMKKSGRNLLVLAGCRFRSIENLEVGDNVSIGYDNFLQARGGLTIGNNVTLAPGVKIWSTNHNYDDPDVPVSRQGHTFKAVRIEDDVFIASNAFVLPGTVLSRGCVVSAGAVVGGKVYRPYSILAGNPARVIGYRGGRTPDSDAIPAQPDAPLVVQASE
jgi:acetyltransferase-like isoleucine patch superfamily enzyme